jgi:hypothetical protein
MSATSTGSIATGAAYVAAKSTTHLGPIDSASRDTESRTRFPEDQKINSVEANSLTNMTTSVRPVTSETAKLAEATREKVVASGDSVVESEASKIQRGVAVFAAKQAAGNGVWANLKYLVATRKATCVELRFENCS